MILPACVSGQSNVCSIVQGQKRALDSQELTLLTVVGWELNFRSLEEQPVFLSAEPISAVLFDMFAFYFLRQDLMWLRLKMTLNV